MLATMPSMGSSALPPGRAARRWRGVGEVFALVAALRPRLRLRPGGLRGALRHGHHVPVSPSRGRARASRSGRSARGEIVAAALARARPPPLPLRAPVSEVQAVARTVAGGTISSLLLAVRDVERHAPMAGCGGVFALVAALRPRLRLRPGGLFDALRHGPRVAVPRPRAGQSFRPDCAQRDKGAVAFARARPPPLFEFYLLTSTFCLLFLSASCTDSQHDFPPRFKTGSGASQSSSSMQGHSHCAKGQDKLTHDFDQVLSKEN